MQQISQMAGMRGLMADPAGRIIELPIRSSFRGGLTVLEYFLSTHGARKGLADTAIRTADSGYLTRRLIDVAQNVIINEEDCGTEAGSWLDGINPGDHDNARDKVLGRLTAEPVIDPSTGEVILDRNELIDEEALGQIFQVRHHPDLRQVSTDLRVPPRGLPQLLRPASGDRRNGEDGRRRRYRGGPVHWRARYSADYAYLPHRWCGRAGHHQRSPAGGGAVRGSGAEGRGRAERDRRRGGDRAERREEVYQVTARETYRDDYPIPEGYEVVAREQEPVSAGDVLAMLEGAEPVVARVSGVVE